MMGKMSRAALGERSLEPGRYRHFKGGEYQVLGVARHTETHEVVVLYCPIEEPGIVWARPIEMFTEEVQRPGGTLPRFRLTGAPSRTSRVGLVWRALGGLERLARLADHTVRGFAARRDFEIAATGPGVRHPTAHPIRRRNTQRSP